MIYPRTLSYNMEESNLGLADGKVHLKVLILYNTISELKKKYPKVLFHYETQTIAIHLM